MGARSTSPRTFPDETIRAFAYIGARAQIQQILAVFPEMRADILGVPDNVPDAVRADAMRQSWKKRKASARRPLSRAARSAAAKAGWKRIKADRKKYKMSAAGRAAIRAAQQLRRMKEQQRKARQDRRTPAGRAKHSAAMRAYWKKRKASAAAQTDAKA